ncbi:MAG: hypothetical protein OXU20_29210 [Myxococcales bacterium]|nr:hypothetical protein [Myxococcales bacterium]
MTIDASLDQMPAAAREILELYKERSEQLRFPDLDTETLADAAGALRDARGQVASAREALERARASEQRQEEVLLAMSRRAFAYARVYAQTDPELADRLGAFALAQDDRKPRRVGKKKKPVEADGRGDGGRKRAAPSDASGELPFDEGQVGLG